MKRITKLLFSIACTLALMLSAVGIFAVAMPAQSDARTSPVKNVILFIGDGMGQEHVRAGAIYKDAPLVFQNFEHIGLNQTRSQSVIEGFGDPFTDSAAGGTAMSTGQKTYNHYVGMDKNKVELESITNIASSKGLKTGVVSSDEINGATPASFLGHADYRKKGDTLLASTVETSRADLIIGQTPFEDFNEGHNFDYYIPKFKDKGFTYTNNYRGLTKNASRMLGTFPIFARDLGYDTAMLDDLVAFSLDYLDNDNGFFLMVEGANIDKRSHLPNADAERGAWMIKELIAFDEAVNVAVNWAKPRGDTLIIVTADHETGGLSIDAGATSETLISKLRFSRTTHTNDDVYYFATGMESKLFQPRIENTDIFQMMLEGIGGR